MTQPTLRPTDEQQRIIEATTAGRSIKVLALAGTGKTSTLRLIAKANPHKRILYLAFGRGIADDARGSFPPNVTVKTAHALAYAGCGHLYKGRIEHNIWGLRAAIVERYGSAIGRWSVGAVLETLGRFCASADRAVNANHVPNPENAAQAARIARHTQIVFDAMIKPEETLPLTHDVYLKVWELGNPRLPYDLVQFDEAQDASAVMLSIVAKQPARLQRVFVGDTSQAIFAFRYAVNAIESLDLPAFPLTQSFRFGERIARAANAILKAKDETLFLRGRPGQDGTIGRIPIPDAILARTNAGLFAEALAIDSVLGPEERLAFIGGVEPLLEAVLAALALWKSSRANDPRLRPKHKDFRYFATWDELVLTSETRAGGTYKPFVRLVDAHKEKLVEMCAQIRRRATSNEKAARVVFSTVHSAKGLEWDRVALAGDFMAFCGEHPKTGALFFEMEEANLAYVALTRAKLALDLSKARQTFADSLLWRTRIPGPVKRIASRGDAYAS